ncbi:MAG: glycerophosphodiester phosphodiesterase [Kiritimatiellia bacterium]|jgi:glycerophosphoryl diester phosphodiesterase
MKKIIIEAHRGARAEASENTLAAFQRALDLKADSIELDVHPAVDGTLMTIHDNTLDRTTDGTGPLTSLSMRELRKLDAGAKFHADFAGERIPTLGEAMGRIAPTNTLLNIEIKRPAPGSRAAEGVVQLLRHYGKAEKYVVSSFDHNALLAVRSLAPEVKLALIGNAADVLARARALHLPWIHCNHTTLTPEIVREAQAAGIHVGVWTVNDPEQVRYWAANGVERMITDDPRTMLALGLG